MLEFTIEGIGLRLFIALGIIYFALGIIDCIRWWNGVDNNGDPK